MSRTLSRAMVTTAAVLSTAAATAGVAVAGGGAAPVPGPSKIVNDCQHARVEPARITLFCGDGNQYLIRMHWQHWAVHIATGHGVFLYNDCLPNCASGHAHREKAFVQAYRPRSRKLGRLFTKAKVTTANGTQVYDLPTSPVGG